VKVVSFESASCVGGGGGDGVVVVGVVVVGVVVVGVVVVGVVVVGVVVVGVVVVGVVVVGVVVVGCPRCGLCDCLHVRAGVLVIGVAAWPAADSAGNVSAHAKPAAATASHRADAICRPALTSLRRTPYKS
jgi:hypothetical protein